MAIDTLDDLRHNLQCAIELEHTTIPVYLCALYSLKEGHNDEAAAVIRSVVMEEMLHMTLAANLLNAIGGKPQVNTPHFVPAYPTYLPHTSKAFMVPLAKFSKETIEAFMLVESPERGAPEPDDEYYYTIGQYYEAIREGFKSLNESIGPDKLFCGEAERQVHPDTWYYGGGGKVIVVNDLASASLAIDEIIEQGEGAPESVLDGDEKLFGEAAEVAHYFRFKEIYLGRRYDLEDTPQTGPTGPIMPVEWDEVWNMKPNPRMSDYPRDSEIYKALLDFNRVYMDLLDHIHAAFNGEPERLMGGGNSMYDLKGLAISLMKIPSGDGETTVGPSFDYLPASLR